MDGIHALLYGYNGAIGGNNLNDIINAARRTHTESVKDILVLGFFRLIFIHFFCSGLRHIRFILVIVCRKT